ncbi:MAG: DUF4157 domain-containing protein [Proteobacteria bacterium]|nr:DUF4157 domain-containing protein [Pseudomonadota bacterium]
MEARFGHDFGRVRVHADPAAADASRHANARAYTVGPDIVFGAGQYRPDRRGGQRLIAHELAHVLQQRDGGASKVHRAILYPDPGPPDRDDPIQRYLLRNDDSLALTTLTINGHDVITPAVLKDAFDPKEIEPKSAPASTSPQQGSGAGSAAGSGSGSSGGSGSGSGTASPAVQCGYKAFDTRISANIRLPQPPADGRWGPQVIERKNIRRRGLPADCGTPDRISTVMKGDPTSTDFYQWMIANEREHASDIVQESNRFLVPDQRAILALRGSGADLTACAADLNQQLSRSTSDNVQRFLQQVHADVAGRDVPGGHKFDVVPTARNHCDNLELLMKKTPPPARGRP